MEQFKLKLLFYRVVFLFMFFKKKKKKFAFKIYYMSVFFSICKDEVFMAQKKSNVQRKIFNLISMFFFIYFLHMNEHEN